MVTSGANDLTELYFDLYTRNYLITWLVEKIRYSTPLKILDVGGRNGELNKFLREDICYIQDILPPENDNKLFYIKGDAKKIPFKNNSFDIVISSDMYEHLSPISREEALNEMFRVSKNFVILGAPFHSYEIERAEIKANEYFSEINGKQHPWLKDHINNKLPIIEKFEATLVNNNYNFIKIGSNNINNWFPMILLIFYASHHEIPLNRIKAINQHYNRNFIELGDSLEPTYRKIYLIAKNKALPHLDFSEISKNADQLKMQELNILLFNAITASAESKDANIRCLDSTIWQLRTDICERDNRISNLTDQLHESDNRISNLTDQLHESDNRISNLTDQLYQTSRRAKSYEYELVEIKKSAIYNLILKFHNSLIEPILPLGTERREVYDSCIKGNRILVNEGYKSLCNKYKDLRSYRNYLDKKSYKRKLEQGPKSLNKITPINTIIDIYRTKSKSCMVINHDASVDIIICVHNALSDVAACLESIIKCTFPPYSLILVDDGSDIPTKSYLENFANIYGAYLVRNETAKGYTFAANQGLKLSKASYIVLLNSDTIVTYEWLDRMIECANSDEKIGMVGPLSNTASWQSIPEVLENGDWSQNELPLGISVEDMGRLVAKYSARCYPKISFLNGFCLMIKRSLIDCIGYFDGEHFGKGYGEENDYCLRAKKAQWELAVADDVYIYHAQSRSYSNETRKLLSKNSDRLLIDKHGHEIIIKGVIDCKHNRVLEGIRARIRVQHSRMQLIKSAKELYEGKRILIILPVIDPGGGSYVIIQESKIMIEMGIDVRLFNLLQHKDKFEASFPELNIPIIYGNEKDIPVVAGKFDAVICTTNTSVAWVKPLERDKKIILAYYIQDFEPYFYPESSKSFKIALNSYTEFPDMIKITKTNWNKQVVREKTGVDCSIIAPSVDIDSFRPRPRYSEITPDRPIYIAAMIRPSTPRRNPLFTLEVLRDIKIQYQDKVRIITFGCNHDELKSLNIPNDFLYEHVGIISREEIAFLLNEIDIFVDYSIYQAMGLTAMEAMACGDAVVVPERGGCKEIVENGFNGLIVDTLSKEDCTNALKKLVKDDALREKIRAQASVDICKMYTENVAYNIVEELFKNDKSSRAL